MNMIKNTTLIAIDCLRSPPTDGHRQVISGLTVWFVYGFLFSDYIYERRYLYIVLFLICGVFFFFKLSFLCMICVSCVSSSLSFLLLLLLLCRVVAE